ncbi:MAG: PD-(D/E)XK nuclease family protein, partial [Tomitella sp.]|nr:PD-(D/E)XK nuclease family protein [Tomitella sp.]
IAAALSASMAGVRGRVGEDGAAVATGSIADGAGRDLDVCVVVGLAEGIVPSAEREDPLVPAAVTGTGVDDRLRRDYRALALTLASGRRERIAMFPRGSLRGGADRVPSRWLLDAMTALAGRPVRSASWQEDSAGCPAIVVVPSFDGAVLTPPPELGASPSTPAEWRMRALASSPRRERATALGDAIVERGIRLRRDRQAGRFTRFTGNLADVAEMIRVFDDPVAPTRLEEWVSSPYLFFVQRVLGATVLPDPDVDVGIDPLRRGDLIHSVLEEYVQEVIDGEPGDLGRLMEIAHAASVRLAASSPGWLPRLWSREAAAIREDMAQWHPRDEADRRLGWFPIAVEQGFGGEEQAQVEVALGGETVRFAGMIDRIDRHTDGRVRVTDYKTGAKKYYETLSEADPTAGCTRFQLGVYGAFARSVAQGGSVSARYWFATGKGRFETVGYPVTDVVSTLLKADLEFVYTAIRSGMFPPRPGSLGVAEIADVIGPEELSATWAALHRAPELAGFLALVEGDH